MAKSPAIVRQYWLWVTRPEHYLNEDGTDSDDLDPDKNVDVGGWYWTCHRETKQGDLAFVWRTSPKKDIGYLMQAESDAYSLADDRYAASQGWKWGCDYRVLYKFSHPITIQELKEHPHLQNWSPLKAKFRSRSLVFRISPEDWEALNLLASQEHPGYQEFLEKIEAEPLVEDTGFPDTEAALQRALIRNLEVLKPFGYDLELVKAERFLKGLPGFVDLLCYDNKRRQFVVIELKIDQADRNTFGQISSYVGWVEDNLKRKKSILPGKKPIGLVISRGCNAQFRAALRITDRVNYLDINNLGFR